jgi:hypothetical protein
MRIRRSVCGGIIWGALNLAPICASGQGLNGWHLALFGAWNEALGSNSDHWSNCYGAGFHCWYDLSSLVAVGGRGGWYQMQLERHAVTSGTRMREMLEVTPAVRWQLPVLFDGAVVVYAQTGAGILIRNLTRASTPGDEADGKTVLSGDATKTDFAFSAGPGIAIGLGEGLRLELSPMFSIGRNRFVSVNLGLDWMSGDNQTTGDGSCRGGSPRGGR